MEDLKPAPLNLQERAIFRRLLGIMIPSDPEMALPCADDPLILEDCITSLGRDAPAIRTIVSELGRTGFLDLPDDQAEERAMAMLVKTGQRCRCSPALWRPPIIAMIA